jgi:hypothetical protein
LPKGKIEERHFIINWWLWIVMVWRWLVHLRFVVALLWKNAFHVGEQKNVFLGSLR